MLDSGNLLREMQASVPRILQPVEIDGKYLADGGTVSNMPADTVREMGVDIAIDIGSEFAPKEELQNSLAILASLSTMMTRANAVQQISNLQPQDILIRPNIRKDLLACWVLYASNRAAELILSFKLTFGHNAPCERGAYCEDTKAKYVPCYRYRNKPQLTFNNDIQMPTIVTITSGWIQQSRGLLLYGKRNFQIECIIKPSQLSIIHPTKLTWQYAC
ncbi:MULTISPECIES: patatin-like phospholipase family protein [unclassified Shewanella]|uniref:patatin-like phospholipase family protein n=1 Tax=unclassified Shewanella TaxID=196818 RepID=UPI0012FF4004|nr:MULTISPECIES: hypothetical protein [unclassified Shewanella]